MPPDVCKVVLAPTYVLFFEPGLLASIVAVIFATILSPLVTVILRVPVSTVYKLVGII